MLRPVCGLALGRWAIVWLLNPPPAGRAGERGRWSGCVPQTGPAPGGGLALTWDRQPVQHPPQLRQADVASRASP